MSNLGPQFTVITQHGEGRTVKRKKFHDFDSAHAHAKAHNPDTVPDMAPNVDDKIANHPDYESGVFHFSQSNKYAVITKAGNRKAWR